MNYKILAVSVIATGAMLAVWVSQSDSSGEEVQVLERVSTMDIAEPSYAPSAVPARELAPTDAVFAPDASGDAEAIGDVPELATGDGPPAAGTGPKIAYRFGYGFRIAADAVKPLQDRHADLCETRGPNVCRIISMEQAESESGSAGGSLHLAVASPVARSFGKDLTRTAESAKGELVSSSIDGEDLSKQIVDTEARLRTRMVLRDRLMDVLKNRRGTVAELVEAERGVAQVNEEIDQARSWLSEMRGRVEFSQMHITYSTGAVTSTGFTEPISEAVSASGATIIGLIAGLIRLLAVILPLTLLIWLGIRGWHWAGRPGAGLLRPMRETGVA